VACRVVVGAVLGGLGACVVVSLEHPDALWWEASTVLLLLKSPPSQNSILICDDVKHWPSEEYRREEVASRSTYVAIVALAGCLMGGGLAFHNR
jgi:hypothetical protein